MKISLSVIVSDVMCAFVMPGWVFICVCHFVMSGCVCSSLIYIQKGDLGLNEIT